MLEMILSPAAIDKDVVEVDDKKFSDEWAQDLIHQPLKHDGRVWETVLYLKGSLPLIFGMNPNLMVSASQINLWEKSASCHRAE